MKLVTITNVIKRRVNKIPLYVLLGVELEWLNQHSIEGWKTAPCYMEIERFKYARKSYKIGGDIDLHDGDGGWCARVGHKYLKWDKDGNRK